MAAKRIDLLSVPVDIIQGEELEEEILAMLAKPSAKQIVFLSVWDLLRARINAEYLVALRNADLILPVSKSIIRGAKFLKMPVPQRYNQFDAVIKVLGILDRHYKSLFLFGAHKKSLMTAERNVRFTFPGLQIVGRYVGYYPKDAEKNITQAIFKASPSLVLIGSGIKKGVLWVHRRRNVFNNSIFLWYSDVIDIFSSRKKFSRCPLAHFRKIGYYSLISCGCCVRNERADNSLTKKRIKQMATKKVAKKPVKKAVKKVAKKAPAKKCCAKKCCKKAVAKKAPAKKVAKKPAKKAKK